MKKKLKLKKSVKNFLGLICTSLLLGITMAIVIVVANNSLNDMYRKCDAVKGRACTYYEAYRLEHPAE